LKGKYPRSAAGMIGRRPSKVWTFAASRMTLDGFDSIPGVPGTNVFSELDIKNFGIVEGR
jgi:hypothetical protein